MSIIKNTINLALIYILVLVYILIYFFHDFLMLPDYLLIFIGIGFLISGVIIEHICCPDHLALEFYIKFYSYLIGITFIASTNYTENIWDKFINCIMKIIN